MDKTIGGPMPNTLRLGVCQDQEKKKATNLSKGGLAISRWKSSSPENPVPDRVVQQGKEFTCTKGLQPRTSRTVFDGCSE
ncbi:hypothetical protein RUM44_012233 [Polyplax serrata]|uniref:Uncharacterized protein n=1 Tax=Polyplax serrata TaxID=468196 RepID=A0ABR1BB32_POLSC